MSDDALDMSHEGLTPPPEPVPPPADPWLARRLLTWGASEVAALMVGLGRVSDEGMAKHVLSNAKHVKRRGLPGTPRVILEKARLVGPLKAETTAMQRGTRYEPQLLREWAFLVGAGQVDGAELVDAATVVHASAVPREFWPLVDRRCPELAVTPDGWARDVFGDLVMLEAKCSVRPYGGLRPHHALQVQAQLAATDREVGYVIEGQGWAAEWLDRGDGPHGPIRTYPVERDEALISEIRDACREGMAMVRELRAKAEEAA